MVSGVSSTSTERVRAYPRFSRADMAMPWSRAKQIARALRGKDQFPEGYTGSRTVQQLNALFVAQFRIQREVSAAAGRYVPMVVENVRGAQKWVGAAMANFGSFYLWGDVGMVGRRVVAGVPKFGVSVAPFKASKVPGFRFDGNGGSFQTASVEHGRKGPGGDWFEDGRQGKDACLEALAQKRNPDGTDHGSGSWFKVAYSKVRGARSETAKVIGIDFNDHRNSSQTSPGFNVTAAQRYREECKQQGSGAAWFDNGLCQKSSKSDSRKAASALIAKIPFPLAQYVARCFKPGSHEQTELLGSGPIPSGLSSENERRE
jgi:hypothetical protein